MKCGVIIANIENTLYKTICVAVYMGSNTHISTILHRFNKVNIDIETPVETRIKARATAHAYININLHDGV